MGGNMVWQWTVKLLIKFPVLPLAPFKKLNFFICFPGAIFEQGTEEIRSAFEYALIRYNNQSTRRFELSAGVDVINTADAFKLSRISK